MSQPEADAAGEAVDERTRLRIPLWLLALFTLSGTLAMHIFVPALPDAAADLGAGQAAMQMTVSLYIFGLAVGQLIYGPVSDRFGRRPTLAFGLALYTVAGLAAAFAPDAYSLIAARLFQALGGCAGMVMGRAIVRDTSMPKEAAQRLALMNLIVTAAPGLAPIIGGAMSATLGWRSIFFGLCALGIANMLFVWRLLPETGRRAEGATARSLSRDYGRLLSSPSFLGYAIGGGCATTSMYAFIAAAPFIFVEQLHRPVHEVGIYIAMLVSGIWLGSGLTSRLITRVRLERLLARANLMSVVAAFVMLGLVLTGNLDMVSLIVTMLVLTVGVGMSAPTSATQAVSVNPNVIGSASGLYGFSQMGVGALCTALAGLGEDPALSAAIVLAVAGVVAQLSFWIARRTAPAGTT